LLCNQENYTRKETHSNNCLASAGNGVRRIEHNVVYVDDFSKCMIRNTLQDLYTQEKRVTTIPKLFPIIKLKMHFPWALSL
jgi:hypothetical protein